MSDDEILGEDDALLLPDEEGVLGGDDIPSSDLFGDTDVEEPDTY